MGKISARYQAYTLAEVLVVLMIVIILGGVGAYSFSGLRDSILVKQNIEEIKQDLQLTRQKAMLLEKQSNEGWIYGLGIDFTEIENGTYKFFKWCSPFNSYGDIRTRSEILAYNPEQVIGVPTEYGPNASLPLSEDWSNSSLCDRAIDNPSIIQSYLTKLPGMEEGKIHAGFNITLINNASYVVFESVTGRAFLYSSDGLPVNYNSSGTYIDNPLVTLGITFFRNRGAIADVISISPLSGGVEHIIVDDPDVLGVLASIRSSRTNFINPLPDNPSEEESESESTPPPPSSGTGLCTTCTSNPRGGTYCLTVECVLQ